VVRGSQEICDQFPEDPWTHFCIGYFEVCLFFKLKNVLLKVIEGLL